MEKSNKLEYVLVGGIVAVGLAVMLIARWVSGPVNSINGVSSPTDWFILGCLGIVAFLCLGYSVWSVWTGAVRLKFNLDCRAYDRMYAKKEKREHERN